jgi:hypothetical protein
MKAYALDSSSKPLSAEQRRAIYWRLWNAAEQARPGLNRFCITTRVLGHVVRIDQLSDEQFAKLCHAFEKIAEKSPAPNGISPHQKKTVLADESGAGCGHDQVGAEEVFDNARTEFQVIERNRRHELLMQFAALCKKMSGNAASKQLGVSHSRIIDWKRRFERDGLDGLIPKQAERCGRKPLAVLSPDHQAHVQRLVIDTDPNTGDRISVSLALRIFAQSDKCPEDVAAAILKPRKSKHTLTPTLKRQAKITAESKQLHRGDKNFALNGYSQPRSLTWIDLDGSEKQILGGDIFEPDDMTLNQPWFVEWHDPADPCSAKFGVRLLRGQLLVIIDVGTQRILGFLLLARQKDSYRAEDIWSWFGQIFRDYGLPRVGIRMERGIWESRAIHGLPILDETWTHERRIGGLSDLGVRKIASFSPKTKSIESLFNSLQKVLGVMGVQVGRKRGEFEKATRDYLACRAGKKHPADCGFLHADEVAKRVANACMFLNGDCREGEVYRGIPDELWMRHVEATPLRAIDPRHAWIFMREKRPLTIGSSCPGMVRARYADHECSYYFTNPELFASLGRGYRVITCFDPAAPELGAVIFNNEAGARDHLNFGAGALLGTAEFVDRVPQFSALEGFDDEIGYERRRRFTAQCRAAYRAIPLPGHRGASATVARDGRGNESRIEFRPDGISHHPGSELQSAGCGAPANREDPVLSRGSAGRSRVDLSGHASPASAKPFDEDAELARIARLERDAIERGDILVT